MWLGTFLMWSFICAGEIGDNTGTAAVTSATKFWAWGSIATVAACSHCAARECSSSFSKSGRTRHGECKGRQRDHNICEIHWPSCWLLLPMKGCRKCLFASLLSQIPVSKNVNLLQAIVNSNESGAEIILAGTNHVTTWRSCLVRLLWMPLPQKLGATNGWASSPCSQCQGCGWFWCPRPDCAL